MGISACAPSAAKDDDEGFGLVEVIIAIVVLGAVAVALLPMIWMGLQISGERGTVATATQLVTAVIDDARSDPAATCADLAVTREKTDGRDVTITVVGAVRFTPAKPTCASFVGPVAVTYTATATDDAGEQLATATTLIYLAAPPEDED